MNKKDVLNQHDIEQIVRSFYNDMLQDSVIGFIFTDVAKIDLETHLPMITNFWTDVVFKQKKYQGNALQKHIELNELMPLKSGHFTRWLYLFNKAVDSEFKGNNAELMKDRAESVAKAISAAITKQKKSDMQLTLPKSR